MVNKNLKGLADLKNKSGKFKIIGNDGKSMKLGWIDHQPWELIESQLKKFDALVSGYDNFVFTGMGGSINTTKVLKKIYGGKNIYIIDSLDPKAMEELKDLKNPIMVAISKSGTTLETIILVERWGKEYIWIKDIDGNLPVQVNGKTDIGGRFNAPETMVFWASLFMILNKDLKKMKQMWVDFGNKREEIEKRMWMKGQELAKKGIQYFQIETNPAFEIWIIQVIQESLGSKITKYNPKTIVSESEHRLKGFTLIKFSDNVMEAMYETEILIASIAYAMGICFVNQPEVEKYKKLLNSDFKGLTNKNKKVDFDFKFVEIVCYWYLTEKEKNKIKAQYQKIYPDKIILVFEGSNWNHHSYQAAYGNKETLYIIASKNVDPILEKIARATYETLKDKALFEVF